MTHLSLQIWWIKNKQTNTNHSDEGLALETSAFLPFAVANLRFQLTKY